LEKHNSAPGSKAFLVDFRRWRAQTPSLTTPICQYMIGNDVDFDIQNLIRFFS
jgi:hypothetical protein